MAINGNDREPTRYYCWCRYCGCKFESYIHNDDICTDECAEKHTEDAEMDPPIEPPGMSDMAQMENELVELRDAATKAFSQLDRLAYMTKYELGDLAKKMPWSAYLDGCESALDELGSVIAEQETPSVEILRHLERRGIA